MSKNKNCFMMNEYRLLIHYCSYILHYYHGELLHMYGFPKICKDVISLRLVVSSQHKTYNMLSRFLIGKVNLLTDKSPSYINNFAYITARCSHSYSPVSHLGCFDPVHQGSYDSVLYANILPTGLQHILTAWRLPRRLTWYSLKQQFVHIKIRQILVDDTKIWYSTHCKKGPKYLKLS